MQLVFEGCSGNEDMPKCMFDTLFGDFSDNKVIFGWLYFDTNSEVEIQGECLAANSDYPVDLTNFSSAFSGLLGDLTATP